MAATEFEENLAYAEDTIRSRINTPLYNKKLLINFIGRLKEDMGNNHQDFINLTYSFIIREVSKNPNITKVPLDEIAGHSFFTLRMAELMHIASEVYGEDYVIQVNSLLLRK